MKTTPLALLVLLAVPLPASASAVKWPAQRVSICLLNPTQPTARSFSRDVKLIQGFKGVVEQFNRLSGLDFVYGGQCTSPTASGVRVKLLYRGGRAQVPLGRRLLQQTQQGGRPGVVLPLGSCPGGAKCTAERFAGVLQRVAGVNNPTPFTKNARSRISVALDLQRLYRSHPRLGSVTKGRAGGGASSACPHGTKWDARHRTCWRCPPGTKRGAAGLMSGQACVGATPTAATCRQRSTRSPRLTSFAVLDSSRGGQYCRGCPEGTVMSGRDMEGPKACKRACNQPGQFRGKDSQGFATCWTCPSGFGRTVVPPGTRPRASNACARGLQYRPAQPQFRIFSGSIADGRLPSAYALTERTNAKCGPGQRLDLRTGRCGGCPKGYAAPPPSAGLDRCVRADLVRGGR